MENLEKYTFRRKVDMRWSDIDELRHANNAVYLTYFEEARVAYFYEICLIDYEILNMILAKATVEFKKPLLHSHKPYIYVRCSRIGNKSFDLEYIITHEAGNSKELIATGSTVMVMYDYKEDKTIPVPEDFRQKLLDFEKELVV